MSKFEVEEVFVYKGHRLRHFTNKDGYACLEITDPKGRGFLQSVLPGTPEAKKLKEGLAGFLKRLG
jgi:hypothetical protein